MSQAESKSTINLAAYDALELELNQSLGVLHCLFYGLGADVSLPLAENAIDAVIASLERSVARLNELYDEQRTGNVVPLHG